MLDTSLSESSTKTGAKAENMENPRDTHENMRDTQESMRDAQESPGMLRNTPGMLRRTPGMLRNTGPSEGDGTSPNTELLVGEGTFAGATPQVTQGLSWELPPCGALILPEHRSLLPLQKSNSL